MVAAKADLIGVASGPELFEARANGVPVIAVGVVIPDSPIVWVSKADSGISSPHDFVGRRVGSQIGTLTEITLEALFARLDLPIEQIERVPMQFDYQPFFSDAIEIAPCYIIDQVVSFRREGHSLNIIDPRNFGINLGPANLYFVHEDTLRVRPDLIRRFLDGAAEGWRFANSNRGEVASYLARFADSTGPEALKEQADAVFSFIGADGDYPGVFPTSGPDVEGTVQILKQYGRIPQEFDSESAWDNSLLSED